MSPLIQVGAPTVILATAILVTFASILRPMIVGRSSSRSMLLNAPFAHEATPTAASTAHPLDTIPVPRFNSPIAARSAASITAPLTVARALPAPPPQAPPAENTEMAEQMRLRALTDYASTVVHLTEVRRTEMPQPTATRVMLHNIRMPVENSPSSEAPLDAAANGYGQPPTAAESRAARLL